MLIRRLRPEDAAATADALTAAYSAGPFPRSDAYFEALRDVMSRNADSEVYVAEEPGGRIVGSVTWCPPGASHRELAGPAEGEFRMLGVDPAASGHGVGRALAQFCLDRAVSLGLDAVVISSAEWMQVAHGMYERMGFVRTPGLDWKPRPDVSLRTYRYDLR